ncbi:MAG TPA: MerR family transcriptional regulator [Rhizomicrobium sp.]|nr:MerR family transcriptional regulator [Rhizomicrobium sp.]
MLASASAALRSKSPEAFRTISEVATELDVPQHVLRFWEGRFIQIKPVKRAGGRRYYRPEDVDLLRGIRTLLYIDGFTIKGVQKILRDRGLRHVAERGRSEAAAAEEAAGETIAALPMIVEGSNVIALDRVPESLSAPEADTARPPLAEEERVKLEILLAELLQLKARLRARAS